MSYKVSVDSTVEADDVLVTFLDVVFRRNSTGSWLIFAFSVAIPLAMTISCWLDGRYLAAMIFCAIAFGLVVCRIIGLSREEPIEQIGQPEELQAQT